MDNIKFVHAIFRGLVLTRNERIILDTLFAYRDAFPTMQVRDKVILNIFNKLGEDFRNNWSGMTEDRQKEFEKLPLFKYLEDTKKKITERHHDVNSHIFIAGMEKELKKHRIEIPSYETVDSTLGNLLDMGLVIQRTEHLKNAKYLWCVSELARKTVYDNWLETDQKVKKV